MPTPPHHPSPHDAALEAFFLGQVGFQECLSLQQRLVYESCGRADGQITLLVCEHEETITIGRAGSRAHISLDAAELASRQIELQWVNRGGGCLPHGPGQLAVYPIVPLEFHRFSVGEYLTRLQRGLQSLLEELAVVCQTRSGRHGLWGRTGQLVSLGVAVKNWTSYHGAFLNVSPAMRPFREVRTDPQEGTAMSCLMLERQSPVKMTTVRAAIVGHLAQAFGVERYHLHSGHPLVPSLRAPREAARAG